MKKLFLFTALLLALTSQAKNITYYSFPDSNAIWNMHYVIYGYGGEYDENYSIIISGDTLINGILYHKLLTPFVQSSGKSKVTWIESGYKGAFRQDIASKKVFIVPPDSLSEQLLYDFNMHAGDTVRGYIERHVSTKDIIDSVDSVLVGVRYHKRWKLSSMTPIYFIEGVGSTFGLIEASTGNIVDGPEISISCFSQNGHTLYPDTVTHCEVILSVEPINKKIDQILQQSLEPLLKKNVDAIALGCTHYPFLRDKIERIVGKNVQVVDSGGAVARRTKAILIHNQILGSKRTDDFYYTTGDKKKFAKAIKSLLKKSPRNIGLIII